MDKNMQVNVNLGGVDALSPKLKSAIDKVNSLTNKAAAAREKLKNIAITANQIKGFEKLRTEVIDSARALQLAKDKAKELGDLTKRSAFALEPYKKATAEVKRLAASHDRLMEKTRAAKAAMAAKGVTTDRLTQQTKALRMEEERLQKVMARESSINAARAKAGAMRSRAGSLAMGGAASLGAGYAITRGMGGAVGEASAFNSELRQIAITADMTDARMKSLGKTIMRTSDLTGQATPVLQSGIGFLIAAGASPEVAEKSINTIGKVASAYKAEVLEISQASFVLNDTLGIQPDKLQGALSMMAKAGKEGNVELRDMAGLLPSLGSGFAALQMKGPEAVATMSAALQIARKGAKSADEAGNNFQNFLTKVMSPDVLKKAQKEFNLDLYGVIQKAQKAGKNPVEAAIEAINKVTKGGDQKLLGSLFGDMQVQAFLRPMLQNLDEYKRIKNEALGAGDGRMIDEDFAKVANDIDVATNRMGNAWQNLKITLGESLAPVLAPIAAWLGRATTAMVEFANKHPKLVQWLAVLVAGLGALLVVGGSIALAIAGILVPLAAVTVGAAMLGIGLLPLTLIILGIGAAIAAVIAAFAYWDEIVLGFQMKIEMLKQSVVAIARALVDSFIGIGSQIIDGLIAGILGRAPILNGTLSKVVKGGVDWVKNLLGIKSPSRVFMEIGGHTAAGLGMGIARGTPGVIANVSRMAAGVTTAGVATLTAGMAMAGAPGGGSAAMPGAGAMSIGQVTIVIEGGQGDPAAIAKAVEDRLRAFNTRSKNNAAARFYEDH